MTNEKNSITIVFGKNLKYYRKKIKLTQEKLGEKVGLSGKHISNIERGVAFPSPGAICSIADVLEVPFYLLFIPEELTDALNPSSIYVSKEAFKNEICDKFKGFVEML